MTSRACGGPSDEHAPALDLDSGQSLDQRLGDKALRDDVGEDATPGEGAGGAGPDRGDGRPPQRPRVETSGIERIEQQASAVGAGQADQRVLADLCGCTPHLRPSRCRARSGSPAARSPRPRGSRRVEASPLAWARARVTTTRRPCSGRRSSQARSSRRFTTGPTTISAGAAMPSARPRRRSSRGWQSPSAVPPWCRARSRLRARSDRARRRSAPRRSQPAV